MAQHCVEANMHDLVHFIFVQNKNNTKVQLTLPHGEHGIRDNHDLFVFCIDLLCKGLVILYGDEDSKVPIESLTQEQLQFVTQKLKNVGLILTVEIKEVETIDGQPVTIKPSIFKGDTDDLKDYKLRIVSKSVEYTIRFDITHV